MSEAEKPKRRDRGEGSIFTAGSNVFWIKYYNAGRPIRESSHSTERAVAEKLLRRRLSQIEDDRFVPPAKVRIDELVADVISDYKLKGCKSGAHVVRRWERHLKPFFTRRKAGEISTATVRRYIDTRVEEGAKPATINRELALLRRAFNLARKSSPPKLAAVPYIPLFRENNRRVGFLEVQQEARLMEECGRFGLWCRTAVEIGIAYGWRLSEVQGLRVRQVNLLHGTLSLDVGSTKNSEGRTAPLTDTLRTLLREAIRGKQANDYVLTRADGSRVKNFRKAWQRSCIRAGLGHLVCPGCESDAGERFARSSCTNCGRKLSKPSYRGLLFHDLRRSMARNMRNEGVAEEVIMQVGGWKTASVFTEAIRRVEAARRRDREEFGQSFGQSAPKAVQVPTFSGRDPRATVLPN